jgi:hypothetical protein
LECSLKERVSYLTRLDCKVRQWKKEKEARNLEESGGLYYFSFFSNFKYSSSEISPDFRRSSGKIIFILVLSDLISGGTLAGFHRLLHPVHLVCLGCQFLHFLPSEVETLNFKLLRKRI